MRRLAILAIVVPTLLAGAAPASSAPDDMRIVDAARRRDMAAIRALLSQGAHVNAPHGDGTTALHWAAYFDDTAAVDLLVQAKANVNAANDLGVTPLYLAASNGSGAVCRALLVAGANPNAAATPTNETPLMIASRTGSVTAVEALLAHGANVNAVEGAHGQTALMWAVANRHPRVAEVLLKKGADVNARSRLDPVMVMIDKSREFIWGGSTPLLFAARSGDIPSAVVLLAAGAQVNDTTPDGTSVLTFAAHSGHGEFAAFLLDRGADSNAAASGYTALHAAVLRGDLGLVKALLAHKADPNATVQRGTPTNRDSKDYALSSAWVGATPFWLAAKFVEPQIMQTLAAAGADPSLATPDGTTPLMVAAGAGHAGRVGVDDRRGRRRDPIEIAIAKESGEDERQALEAVKVVTEIGKYDVNARNAAGDTAVHAAVSNRYASVVRWLAGNGAKLDLVNKRGQTPLSIAGTRFRGQADEGSVDEEMIELLRQLGVSR